VQVVGLVAVGVEEVVGVFLQVEESVLEEELEQGEESGLEVLEELAEHEVPVAPGVLAGPEALGLGLGRLRLGFQRGLAWRHGGRG
jgi:hypothetical protein